MTVYTYVHVSVFSDVSLKNIPIHAKGGIAYMIVYRYVAMLANFFSSITLT